MCNLFHSKKKEASSISKPAWLHKFVCLAYKDQTRTPASDLDKDELYQAGLEEKDICFPTLDITPEGFKELLYERLPPPLSLSDPGLSGEDKCMYGLFLPAVSEVLVMHGHLVTILP